MGEKFATDFVSNSLNCKVGDIAEDCIVSSMYCLYIIIYNGQGTLIWLWYMGIQVICTDGALPDFGE